LKPLNILLDKASFDATLKICDFGMARYISKSDDMENLHSVVGTKIYQAPELHQFEGYTIKADLWSLGVILLDLLIWNNLWRTKKIFLSKE
jgi:serine/threonine protein kinase